MLPKKALLLVLLLVLIVPLTSLVAQSQPTVSIALPINMKTVLDLQGDIFSDFEKANNVSVYVNYVDADIPPMAGGIDAYLDAIAKYAAAADVLYFQSSGVTDAVTRAGYLLDLSPLTSADSSLNSSDFTPAAWNSMQWDGGLWGLPISLDATMLIYDPSAFDKAGLSYPNDHWTMDDLANAAKALSQTDSNGNVTVPGLAAFGDIPALFRSLYGKNFFDDSGNPNFADPALEDILSKWQDMVSSGYVGSSFSSGANQPPMRIMNSIGLGFPLDSNQPQPQAVALPGGKVGLSVDALAISSGTTQPELAYKLAEYLTNSAAFVSGPFNGIPARQSLASQQSAPQGNLTVVGGGSSSTSGSSSGDSGNNGGVTFSIGKLSSPAAQAALTQLLPDALTLSELGYGDYVNAALNALSQGTDAHTALQQEETQAVADLQSAAARKSSVSVIVATPPPPVVLAPGKIALKFGIEGNIQPIPNLDQWQQMAADFSSSDPNVGEITYDTDPRGASQFAQKDDCFYLNANAVPDLDETTILNLDPYLEADTSFDQSDVLNGVMAQLQKDNHTWAYPLTIQPQTLRYNSDIFQKAGVPDPSNGWTISQFTDALKALKTYLNTAPFDPHDLDGESLMMLIAAYGGLPIDYRTNPATINFTDPATISAIQQVLDLAKNGYMTYQQLAGGKFRVISISSGSQEAITTDALLGFRQIKGGGTDPFRVAAFPTGTYNGVSYTIGTGYISATSQNPDACYRWLTYIAQHIDVLNEMPARLSQVKADQSANASFYASYAQLLQDSKTIVFPAAGSINSIGDFIIQFWLNRAFDNYVQNNADLTSELTNAQNDATAFQQCVQALPPAEQTDGVVGKTINTKITDCAKAADPSVADLFAPAPATSANGG